MEALQRDLDEITAFYAGVGLSLNARKSNVLLCAVSSNVNFTNVYFNLQGQPLPIVSKLKYLGATFSQNLSFDDHVNNVVSKAKRVLGALFNTCALVPKEYM